MTDRSPVKSRGVYTYMTCPMCECEIPLAGDEKVGEDIFCPFCETPLKLRKKKEDDTLFLQEDF